MCLRWAMRCCTLCPASATFASDLKVSGTTLENAALRVVVDPKTGCITSLFDKKAGFETLAAGLVRQSNCRHSRTLPKDYDAWNIDPGTLDQPPTLLTQADSVEVVENGPMRGVDSRDAHLAELEVCAGDRARRRQRTRSWW